MSLWGEIVEPTSRASWNDDDEEETTSSLSWKNPLPAKDKIDTFLILEGRHLGSYNGADMHLRLINSIPEVSLNLYEDEKNSRIICCIKYYELMRASEIVELLSDYLLVSASVIAVISKPLAEYKSETLTNSPCLIRSLSTSKWTPHPRYPQLEQPNIISGVSAGVLSLSEHIDKDAVAHVCYLEHPDSVDSDDLRTLLNKLNIGRIRPLSAVATSNLYI